MDACAESRSNQLCICGTHENGVYIRCAGGKDAPCGGRVHPTCVGLFPTAMPPAGWKCSLCAGGFASTISAASDPILFSSQSRCTTIEDDDDEEDDDSEDGETLDSETSEINELRSLVDSLDDDQVPVVLIFRPPF